MIPSMVKVLPGGPVRANSRVGKEMVGNHLMDLHLMQPSLNWKQLPVYSCCFQDNQGGVEYFNNFLV